VSVERVTDADDPRLDDYRHLREPSLRVAVEREREVFTVEGRLSVEVLLASGHRVRSVLVDERRAERFVPLVDRDDVDIYVVPAEVVEAVSGFAFHRGLLAVAERPPARPIEDVVAGARRLLVTENVNDFENLGALYRNAAAFGVEGVLLDPGTAEPLYRRVVRVSIGHVLHIPTARVPEDRWPGLLADLDVEVLALTPSGDESLAEVAAAPPSRWAVLVGAEGPGLTAGALAAADRRVRIPMASQVDSVNVATAAAIALHALAAGSGAAVPAATGGSGDGGS
jgi:tRNA G18 (ribose-2'-O)-methylase SpoU